MQQETFDHPLSAIGPEIPIRLEDQCETRTEDLMEFVRDLGLPVPEESTTESGSMPDLMLLESAEDQHLLSYYDYLINPD